MLFRSIALCHVILSLEHAGKEYKTEVSSPAKTRDGYDYFMTFDLD